MGAGLRCRDYLNWLQSMDLDTEWIWEGPRNRGEGKGSQEGVFKLSHNVQKQDNFPLQFGSLLGTEHTSMAV